MDKFLTVVWRKVTLLPETARRNPRRCASKTFRRRLRVVRIYEWYEYRRSGISAVSVSRGVIFVPHATRCSERRGLGVVVTAGTPRFTIDSSLRETYISQPTILPFAFTSKDNAYKFYYSSLLFLARFHHFSNLS